MCTSQICHIRDVCSRCEVPRAATSVQAAAGRVSIGSRITESSDLRVSYWLPRCYSVLVLGRGRKESPSGNARQLVGTRLSVKWSSFPECMSPTGPGGAGMKY